MLSYVLTDGITTNLWVLTGVTIDRAIGLAPLQAAVTLATVNATTSDDPSVAQLTGRTTGTADAKGLIIVPDLLVSAVPGLYNLSVSLTDFPMVCVTSSYNTAGKIN